MRDAALASFRLWQRYFRFEVDGFEIVAESPPALLVGYHGGPWALDLLMLGARVHDELGYFPRACWHPGWWSVPAVGKVVSELGGLPGRPTDAEMNALKARGEHFVFAPGAMTEGLRPFWEAGRVDFGRHRGYAKLALAHELPIIPVVSPGMDRTYVGLNSGLPWLGLGVGGVWPFALPFPVKIRQRIGPPIAPKGDVEELHATVTATLQAMLE